MTSSTQGLDKGDLNTPQKNTEADLEKKGSTCMFLAKITNTHTNSHKYNA